MKENKEYIKARTRLINHATEMVLAEKERQKSLGKKWFTKTHDPYYFTLYMTQLAAQARLINKGNLTLFKAKHLPTWKNPNNI